MNLVPALQQVEGTPSLEWLTEEFGSLAPVPAMILRFKATIDVDVRSLLATREPAHAAALLHRIGGGVRVFGPSRLAGEIDVLEAQLRGGDAVGAMDRLRSLVDSLGAFIASLDVAMRSMPMK